MSVEKTRDAMAEPIEDYETPLDEQDGSELAEFTSPDPLDYTSQELMPTDPPIDTNDGASGLITPRYDDAVETTNDELVSERKERAPQPDLQPGEKLVRKFAVKSECPPVGGANVYSGGIGTDAGGWGSSCNMYGPAMREIGGGATQVNILWVSYSKIS